MKQNNSINISLGLVLYNNVHLHCNCEFSNVSGTHMHAGVLGIVGGINGEPTDPWYLMGAASLAALLLPFVATPLAWVVVEVLRNQADKASSEFSVPTEQPKTDEQVVKKQSRVLSVLVPGEGDSSPGAVRSEHDIADVDNLTNRRPTTELKARNIEFLEAEVYNVQPHKIDSSKFQSLNAGACAMLYITLMCFSLSIVCCKLSLHVLCIAAACVNIL